jgi:hypothetical protein
MKTQLFESLQNGTAVKEILTDEKGAPVINEAYKQFVTARLIDNQISFLKEGNNSTPSTNATGAGVQNWDPVLISMVRQATPQMMAFDIAGVQPMTGPTGLIFAIRSRYAAQDGTEALFDEANTAFSGAGTQAGDTSGFPENYFEAGDPDADTTHGTGMATAAAEALGTSDGSAWAEMAFSIEKTSVEAKSRKLKASFTHEIAHDLRKIHGLDAEQELANILSTEVLSEMDRELIRRVNIAAVIGAQGTTTPGMFDVANDSDGRWMVERWKGVVYQLEKEANAIARTTRRGKGNIVVCSANVASALVMAGLLDTGTNNRYSASLNVDETTSTYAGVLNGRYRVYIDPFSARDYITVAYRGANAWDAGIYHCPYVPMEMYRAIGEDSFQPRIGIATRYGVVANPFSANTASGEKAGKGLGQGENPYYRKFAVSGL